MARKTGRCVYPFPVYQGHFDNGRVVRLSIYIPAKAGIEEAARRGRKIMQRWCDPSWHVQDRSLEGCTLIAGYVEDKRYPGKAWHVDDFQDAPAKAKRVSKAEWQAVMRKLLDATNGDTPPAVLARANELLAA